MLVQLLVQESFITADQLATAEQEAKHQGHTLEHTLVALGFVSERVLVERRAALEGLEPKDLTHDLESRLRTLYAQ